MDGSGGETALRVGVGFDVGSEHEALPHEKTKKKAEIAVIVGYKKNVRVWKSGDKWERGLGRRKKPPSVCRQR